MPFANVNGARLWYDVLPATRSAADTLLLHHGYTASRVNWLPVAQRLAGRYQVVLMECRGTGESEHTADGYTLEQYAADVIGVADHLRLAQFTYAGHSMGGGVGYVLALNYAARLSRLILMAAVPADGFPVPDVAAREQHIAVRKRRDRQTLLEQYRAGRIRPDVETDAWFNSRVDHIFSVSDGHYEQGAESMQKLSVGDRLGTLITPTLVLAGAGDGLLSANIDDFRRLPNATLHVFSRAGHELAIHEPAGVADAIDAFMTYGLPRPPA